VEENFGRDESGFVALLVEAGFVEVTGRTLSWDHRVSAGDWWSGPAAGIGFFGQVLLTRSVAEVAAIRSVFDRLSAEYRGPDGRLVLPQRALLVSGRA
jgi:hypothetical protein